FAEWSQVLTLICGTADRIGHEIYNLARTEIGEVSEGGSRDSIGSITMPHKNNPEISEHLGTLSRTVRYNAFMLLEGLVHDHERDGRSWKAEWNALPLITLASGKALELLRSVIANLEVHSARMRENLELAGGSMCSEWVMLALAKKIGRKSAHELV